MSQHESAGKQAAKCPFGHSSTPAVGLADTLKEQTKAAHAMAERHPIQSRMVKGESSREQYTAYLGQLLPVWKAIDAGLWVKAASDPRVASMVKPYHANAGRVAADLAFLGAKPGDVLPATQGFVDMVKSASNGVGIVGAWYVLEGSTNGGRYIAKALSRGLGITGPEGLTSFDPHGEQQRERWQAWRASLDAQTWTEAERAEIVNAATGTFEAIYELMEGMDAAAASSAT
ncbi:MAG: biliverdin-producing heme oxygenase [Planctomycetota bacterium]